MQNESRSGVIQQRRFLRDGRRFGKHTCEVEVGRKGGRQVGRKSSVIFVELSKFKLSFVFSSFPGPGVEVMLVVKW